MSFNSRARGGRDVFPFYRYAMEFVSIHAPVEGATTTIHDKLHQMGVSIHAPVEGATPKELWRAIWEQQFQFTRPWRARLARLVLPQLPGHSFNSRARGGRDPFECNVLLTQRLYICLR